MPLYDQIGRNYARLRRPERQVAAMIDAALGDASSVLNVGAGSGPPGLARLRGDLASGRWLQRNPDLLARDAMDLGYRVVSCEAH